MKTHIVNLSFHIHVKWVRKRERCLLEKEWGRYKDEKYLSRKKNEIIRLGNKIVVFKIIVINAVIRLENEIIFFGIFIIIVQGQPYKELGKMNCLRMTIWKIKQNLPYTSPSKTIVNGIITHKFSYCHTLSVPLFAHKNRDVTHWCF